MESKIGHFHSTAVHFLCEESFCFYYIFLYCGHVGVCVRVFVCVILNLG